MRQAQGLLTLFEQGGTACSTRPGEGDLMKIPISRATQTAYDIPLVWTRSCPICGLRLQKADPANPWSCRRCGWNTKERAGGAEGAILLSILPRR